MPEVKQGWNEWAGTGVNQKNFNQKVERAERIKQQKIAELKKNRLDAKMKGVIVNTEDRDKKFAQKYWIKELPHNFRSKEQFQKHMDMAVGKEWSTQQTFKRLVQPEVLTKAGEIIKPLAYQKETKVQTLDSLVQHRLNKRQKRPAAKF